MFEGAHRSRRPVIGSRRGARNRARASGGRGPTRWGRGLAILIVLIGVAASLGLNYPGHFPPDAISQLAQGRTGLYNFWHPPVMAWMLGLADRAWAGAWPFVALDAVMFYGALLAFVLLEPRPRLACLPLLAMWMISPVVLIYQGVALKDVLFADAALAGFAAVAWAGHVWSAPGVRHALLAIAGAAFAIAALTRQNGLIAPLFGTMSLVVIVLTREPAVTSLRVRAVTATITGGVFLGLMAIAVAVANVAFERHSDHRPETAHHMRVLQIYDLAGVLHADPRIDLPILRRERPGLETFLRHAAPLYRAAGVDNLVSLPGAERLLAAPADAVQRQWSDIVRRRPGLYLATRAQVWLTTLLTPSSASCPMIFTGVDPGDPRTLRLAGLVAREDDRDDDLGDYATAFLRGPLYSHVFYIALIVAALALGFRRWLRGDRAPGLIGAMGLGLAGLAFAGSFFVISIDCDFRYLYFLDVAAMAATSYELAARSGARGR